MDSLSQVDFRGATLPGDPQGSRGVSIGDLNGDGLLDIVVATQVDSTHLIGNTILLNKGSEFKRIAISQNTLHAWSESAHTADVDNDQDLDIFFTTQFGVPNLLYLNDGLGNYSLASGGDLGADNTNSPGACWCDYDLDGDLDVFVLNRDGADDNLYVNDGKGTFKRSEIGPWIGNSGDGRSCAWGDLNGDRLPDLYVANYVLKNNGHVVSKHRNYLYMTNADGSYREQKKGELVEELNASYGVSLIDYDHDKDLDIYVTNVSVVDENAFYENLGSGVFRKLVSSEVSYEVHRPSKGQTWGDFNNDGSLDLYVANGTEGYPEIQNFFFLGSSKNSFQRIYNTLPAIEGHISAGTAAGDLDNDGDLDLYVCNWGGEAEPDDLYVNDHRDGHWVKFRLRGSKSNTFGIGSWVILEMQDGTRLTKYFSRETGYGSENAPEVHFGLGNAEVINKVTIEWPSGIIQTESNLKANRSYKVTEGANFKGNDK